MIRLLDKDESISYVCYTGSYNEAKKLVKVHRKSKKKGNMIDAAETNVSAAHEKFAKEVVLGLSLGNGEFLINVMWVDELAKRYHRLYPKVLGADVAFGTNAEKRGLHRGCSKTIDDRNIPNIYCFMPSNQA